MEDVADIEDELSFLVNEVELRCDVAVHALASLSSDGHDGGIRHLHLFVHADRTDGNLGVLLLSEHLHLIPLGRMALSLELHLGVFDVLPIDVCECLRRADAGILQPLHHVDDVRGVYTARASASRQELVGVRSEECDGLYL